jgi:hypothetical protein
VPLVGLKVLDGNGAGRTSDVLSAIEYAVTNRDALGLRVLNLSPRGIGWCRRSVRTARSAVIGRVNSCG